MQCNPTKQLSRLLIIVLILPSTLAFADSPAPNIQTRTYSANKEFYIDMIPLLGWGGYGDGEGIAYAAGSEETAEPLWSVDFFSGQVTLTNDGRHLVAFGPWASRLSDLALAFYQDGNLLKEYSIEDLVKDPSQLIRTVSHFFWRARTYNLPGDNSNEGLSEDESFFFLTTIDGIVYKFSVTTGEIVCYNYISEPDCTFCTWTTAGEACNPSSPRDLFDIDSIQALTLDDLDWELLDSQTYNNVTIVRGDFSGGLFKTYNSEGKAKTVELHYSAALFIPEGWPRPGDPNVGYVSAVHHEGNLLQLIAVQIANYFRVPVLHHAQYPRDWIKLGYPTRNEINKASFPNVASNNLCEPIDIVRGHFGLAMAQADMRAITLLQRFAESVGGEIHKVAFRGFSKEGRAGWLAATVDPRIEVAALGGYHSQNMIDSRKIQIASWGCYGNPMEADPNGPQTAGIGLDWLMNTPAGAAYINLYDDYHNKDLLYPRFILIDGDVGMLGMHDQLFALGTETPFLDNFTEIPWRYVRKSTFTKGSTDDDGDVISKAVVPGLLVENLIEGPGSEDLIYPKVISASAIIMDDMLIVEATASEPTESMALWWSWSDDRVWNDDGQVPWVEVHMTMDTNGLWASPPVPVEPGKVVGWYVEARNTALIGEQERTRTDAGAVHFLRETEPWICSPEIPDWCGEE